MRETLPRNTSPASETLSTAPHRDNKFEMIHDQLVMGIRDSSLSVRLQTGAALTLEKTKTVMRQHKAVQEQQLILSHGDKSDQRSVINYVKRRSTQRQGGASQQLPALRPPQQAPTANHDPSANAHDVG